MTTNPLETVYTFVERAYVRLQAGDLLDRCLEEQDATPLQQWAENLILAGPQSVPILREIIAEVSLRRMQVGDNLGKAMNEFELKMTNLGVRLNEPQNILSIRYLTPMRLLSLLRAQGITEEHVRLESLKALRSTRQLTATLVSQIYLLREIEGYLRDWLWGLMYQTAHQDQAGYCPTDLL